MLLYAPAALHVAIAAVCPIDGIYIGDPTNPATWGFWPSSAIPPTPTQLQAANALLAQVTPASLAQADTTVAAAVAALPNPLASAQTMALTQIVPPNAVGSQPTVA
jgi:hypothetical protein